MDTVLVTDRIVEEGFVSSINYVMPTGKHIINPLSTVRRSLIDEISDLTMYRSEGSLLSLKHTSAHVPESTEHYNPLWHPPHHAVQATVHSLEKAEQVVGDWRMDVYRKEHL